MALSFIMRLYFRYKFMNSFFARDLAIPALSLGLAYEGNRNVMVSRKPIRFPCDAA
jgi:hypothetical protein